MTRFDVIDNALRLNDAVEAVAAETTLQRILRPVQSRLCDARITAAGGNLEEAERILKEAETCIKLTPIIVGCMRSRRPLQEASVKAAGGSFELLFVLLDELQFGYRKGRGQSKDLVFFD